MKFPQVLNGSEVSNPHAVKDNYTTIDANNVIDNTTEVKLAPTATSIPITIKILDMTDLSTTTNNTTMTYDSIFDVYTIPVSAIVGMLDRRTYIGIVVENGITYNMRDIKLDAFSYDKDGFEDSWMRMPYQVEISGGQAWIRWYDGASPGVGTIRWEAPAYEGGTGTTYATLPERVTHRGAIESV